MKKILSISICLFISGAGSFLFGQETTQTSSAKEKMVCEKIDLQIQTSTYNDALRCETKDAICYMIEGFSMSCIPKTSSTNK